MSTIRTDKRTHILHQPQNRHSHLLQHGHSAHGIPQSQILRSRNNHGASEGYALRQCQLHISRARRQIYHEHVEGRPGDFEEELCESFLEHETAPRERLRRGDEEAHGHGVDAVGGQWDEAGVAVEMGFVGFEIQEGGEAGAVDVCVEDADVEGSLLDLCSLLLLLL